MTTRPTVVGVVKDVLQRFYEQEGIHAATFTKVQEEVKKHFPQSKFNPFHLAWYKHHFLKGDLDELYRAKIHADEMP